MLFDLTFGRSLKLSSTHGLFKIAIIRINDFSDPVMVCVSIIVGWNDTFCK